MQALAEGIGLGQVVALEVKVTFMAGAKLNRPLVISLVEENPTTVTVMPPGVCWKLTLLMNGTPELLTIVLVVLPRSIPPAVRSVVKVIVPAVVPVSTVMLLAPVSVGVVLPAGMVKLMVRL